MVTENAIADLPPEEFLKNLAESGLSCLDQARELATEPSFSSGARIAVKLVADGSLTQFQARALLQGKTSSLRMGNYEILDKLGAGGMGAVYKARHRRMKRIVALKVLSKAIASSAAFNQRFQREVEAISKLQHQNVVMAFDADEAEEGPFLIMEFVDGCDLTNVVIQGGPLSVADAVDCILQSARGLECAHKQGIVHRDIKPSNLMRDRGGIVKVTDLGLARLNGTETEASANHALTQAGSVLGTVDYMAPEQAVDSTAVDARADIYSLGSTLYFLLTGQPPYKAGSLMALLLKHRDAPIPSLCETRTDVPPALDALYHRMVAKNPDDRFTNISEVITALECLAKSTLLNDLRPDAEFDVATGDATDQTTIRPVEIDTNPASTAVTSSRGIVAVLVEPSRTQANIIARYLEQMGFSKVHLTKSGQEALDLARRENANFIVSSMHLSDMTGIQLAQTVLADETCNNMMFVLATSASETDEATSQIIGPRVALLPKPFDLHRLEIAIESLLN